MIATITHRPVAQDRAAMGSPGQTGMTPGGTGQLSGWLARSGSGGATGELYSVALHSFRMPSMREQQAQMVPCVSGKGCLLMRGRGKGGHCHCLPLHASGGIWAMCLHQTHGTRYSLIEGV